MGHPGCYTAAMPTGLRRFQQSGDVHAINFCCFRNRPILATPEPRDTFLKILEETRAKYGFHVLGYVVMPTHIHLLVTEPEGHKLSTAIQVLKQRFSRTRIETEVWEDRYYDFNVKSRDKLIEKLRYIHYNPVEAGLVPDPASWQWSSYRDYVYNESGPVVITRV
jgi:putative transposase